MNQYRFTLHSERNNSILLNIPLEITWITLCNTLKESLKFNGSIGSMQLVQYDGLDVGDRICDIHDFQASLNYYQESMVFDLYILPSSTTSIPDVITQLPTFTSILDSLEKLNSYSSNDTRVKPTSDESLKHPSMAHLKTYAEIDAERIIEEQKRKLAAAAEDLKRLQDLLEKEKHESLKQDSEDQKSINIIVHPKTIQEELKATRKLRLSNVLSEDENVIMDIDNSKQVADEQNFDISNKRNRAELMAKERLAALDKRRYENSKTIVLPTREHSKISKSNSSFEDENDDSDSLWSNTALERARMRAIQIETKSRSDLTQLTTSRNAKSLISRGEGAENVVRIEVC